MAEKTPFRKKRLMDILETQPARSRNRSAIRTILEEGCTQTEKRLGIELEHILVDNTGDPISYSQPDGVRDVLEALSARYPRRTTHEGDLLGVSKPGMSVTIEPAAQLELSAGPFASIDEARRSFEEFESDVHAALAPVDGRALTIGYDPVNRATDKELIPKARYDFMNTYLSSISPWGPRMMRGSASTQISIDYRDEADCVKKARVASILSPLFALMCDNSPFFEGGHRPHPLMRTEIWRHCDPDRCNTVPGMLDEGFGFDSYANYILDTPAIVVLDNDGEARYDTRTFGEIYAHEPMTRDQALHALSMVFPDVRLKTYVEIRPADAMPIPYVMSYAALIKGLFYCDESLDALTRSCEGIRERDVEDAKTALMKRGYRAFVYDRDAGEMCDELMDLARRGLLRIAPHEKEYLKPLAGLVARRATLADLALT